MLCLFKLLFDSVTVATRNETTFIYQTHWQVCNQFYIRLVLCCITFVISILTFECVHGVAAVNGSDIYE